MSPYFDQGGATIYHGDCLEVMRQLAPESVDAIVTDPPYALTSGNAKYDLARTGSGNPRKRRPKGPNGGFMGKAWDAAIPGPEYWVEALRVAKPGAHLLTFGGTRTFHRLMVAIEDAGWEIRDTVMWVYGSGFPKSLDVSKAIDKEAGAERERIRGVRSGVVKGTYAQDAWSREFKDSVLDSTPLTDAGKQWAGWGTALKPAWEPICVARKPLVGTVAQNVQRYGTGALNIDASRIPGTKPDTTRGAGGQHGITSPRGAQGRIIDNGSGRWPANLIHDGSEEVREGFPEPHGAGHARDGSANPRPARREGSVPVAPVTNTGDMFRFGDSGSAARFFYCSKSDKRDRFSEAGNDHPTVKPLDLMRYLIRLVTPPGGLVLDPFAGSGSTIVAARDLGFRSIGIDLEERHCQIAAARMNQGTLDFGGAA